MISARSQYACRALVELAETYPQQGIKQLKQIAQAQSIPEKYLVHILLQLKRQGLVGSLRGAGGGYYLCLDPARISLGQVIRTVDGPLLPLKNSPGKKNDFKTVWQDVAARMQEVLDNISLADIVLKIRAGTKDSYQI